MSILTFSDAFLKQFGRVVYPKLQDNYVRYSKYFKVHSNDSNETNINNWLAQGTTAALPLLKKICEAEGFDADFDGNDDTMQAITTWVKNNVTYTPDMVIYKQADYWQTPQETLSLRTGDCEDGATLIMALAYAAKVPIYRYWLQWGEVIGGGHCYVCYLRDTDAEEVVLDWCYWWTSMLIRLRDWLGADNRYKTIWGTAKLSGI